MSERKPLTDEQLDAIWKEMLKPNSRKPLTLEELRSMDGKPVWVHVVDHTVFADKEDDFDGYGLVRKSWVRVWDEKRADLIYVDYDFCGYGKEWLAYAYDPDMERDCGHFIRAQRWIPVEERMPEPMEWVLAFTRGRRKYQVVRYDNIMDDWDSTIANEGFIKPYVTHWMHLPEPPEVSE